MTTLRISRSGLLHDRFVAAIVSEITVNGAAAMNYEIGPSLKHSVATVESELQTIS
jgi:hypothetical protein